MTADDWTALLLGPPYQAYRQITGSAPVQEATDSAGGLLSGAGEGAEAAGEGVGDAARQVGMGVKIAIILVAILLTLAIIATIAYLVWRFVP